jgi:hypothetical protein
MLFVVSFVMMGAYTGYKYFAGTVETLDIWNLLVLPAIFTTVYWGGDSILQKIADKKKKIDYEGLFLDAIGAMMRDSKAFLIEDFRHLQISTRFQDAMKTAYYISQNGESDHFNLDRLEKKFEKRSLEYKAMQFVIPFVKEKLANKSK